MASEADSEHIEAVLNEIRLYQTDRDGNGQEVQDNEMDMRAPWVRVRARAKGDEKWAHFKITSEVAGQIEAVITYTNHGIPSVKHVSKPDKKTLRFKIPLSNFEIVPKEDRNECGVTVKVDVSAKGGKSYKSFKLRSSLEKCTVYY